MKKLLNTTLQTLLNLFKKGFGYVKEHYVKIGFYLLAFMFFINAIFMTLFLLNRKYDYIILDQLYIEAVLPGQDIDDTLYTGIVKIEEIDYDAIDGGDRVVFCCAYGIDENWVQDVVTINKEEKRLTTTYDGVVTSNITEGDVHGVFIEEANFIGTFYYTAMFPRGYFLLILSQTFFIYLYHYLFIQRRFEVFRKETQQTESDDEHETA